MAGGDASPDTVKSAECCRQSRNVLQSSYVAYDATCQCIFFNADVQSVSVLSRDKSYGGEFLKCRISKVIMMEMEYDNDKGAEAKADRDPAKTSFARFDRFVPRGLRDPDQDALQTCVNLPDTRSRPRIFVVFVNEISGLFLPAKSAAAC